MVYEIFLCLFLLGAAYYFLFLRKRRNYPPGPLTYPIIGNLLSLGVEFHKTFLEHGKKYGPISSFKMGLEEAVILHDVKLIKEAFSEMAFSGRPVAATTECFAGKRDGIFQADGRIWLEQRRFALRTLRDFGFGRKSMESTIMDEVVEFTDWIAKQGGKPISLEGRISLAIVNALWTILTGHRYDHDDPRLLKIITEQEAAEGAIQKGAFWAFLIAHYPGVAKKFPNWSGWNELIKLSNSRLDHFHGIIQEHQLNRVEQPRDFIDVYLAEVDKTQDPTSSFHPSTATKSLQSVMSDFYIGGTDTQTVTLNWTILYLIHNPRVQQKLHEELDRVLGTRRPSLNDRNDLPYVEAFINEVLRFSSMVPLGVGHCTMEDVQFHGYQIPKGTKVFSNIYAVHYDPKIWGDPEVFRPERFLSADGRIVQKNENFIPFGVGKRICVAFNLALDQLFLFVTCIVQRFEVSEELGKPKPSLKPRVGTITLAPHHYTVRMTERI